MRREKLGDIAVLAIIIGSVLVPVIVYYLKALFVVPLTSAQYTVVFESTWSAETHPTDFPADPHYSGLIGATHNARVTFWQYGALASDGIKRMAEFGSKNPLDSEVYTAITSGNAEFILSGGNIPLSPGSVSLTFNITQQYSLVTLVLMIAPSPDWFVGVSGLNLIEMGGWAQEKVVDLYPWDAGTDSGVSYTSSDLATDPPVGISLITTDPFLKDGAVAPLGTFTFTRIDQ